jgi:hypothetical protein
MSGDKEVSAGNKGEGGGVAPPAAPALPPMQEFAKSNPVGDLFQRGA